MKKIIIAVFYLVSSMAWAQEPGESKAEENEKVDLRMSVIESIVVTAEKAPAQSIEETDEDIDAILDEVETLEDDDTSE
jgi:hypothetical protein